MEDFMKRMLVKNDPSRCRNQPAPQGMELPFTEIEFNKPVPAKKPDQFGFQSIVHLLDQYLLTTPPDSGDEDVLEPGVIATPPMGETEEPRPTQHMEIEDPIMWNLILECKEKKVCAPEISPTKKRKEESDSEERPFRHSGTQKKQVSTKRQYHKLSAEESPRPGHSNSSSPYLYTSSHLPRSTKRSSKYPKSPSIRRKRRKSCHRSESLSRTSDQDGSRSVRKSPLHRRKSPIRYSPLRRSSRTPPLYRWSPKHRSPVPRSRRSPLQRSSACRTPGRGSSACRSPGAGSSACRSPLGVSSACRSPPKGSSAYRSPCRRSALSRSPSRRSALSRSPSRRSALSRSPSRRSAISKSSSLLRSLSSSPDRPRAYRGRQRSSSRKRPRNDKCYSPDRIRAHRSPTRDRARKCLVPYGGSSGSSSSSTDEECLSMRCQEKEKPLDRYQKKAAAKPQIKRLTITTSKLRMPIVEQDEYRELLVEEMIRDSNDEPSMVKEKTASVRLKEVPVKKEPVGDKTSGPESHDRDSNELGKANTNELQKKSIPLSQFVKPENIKRELADQQGALLNIYYCQICQLELNSDVMWESHINGKKHGKMLKLQTVHEIAKGSIGIPSTPVVSQDIPRFADPPAGKTRHRIDSVARLQPAIDEVTNHPLPGLSCVQEIITETDVTYYCDLCDAPCGPSSIMPHLIGFKHQLNCLKIISPGLYEENKHRTKSSYGSELVSRLRRYERDNGRGIIKVFIEQFDTSSRPSYEIPRSRWRNTSSIPYIKKEVTNNGEAEIPMNDECLDLSKGIFFCILCDAHMNNQNMWEAHVRGKRHLKNAKKIPGENISKLKSVKAPPGTPSKLDELLYEFASGELVVGLDFIKETQGINGEIYNCFLCGSCSTNYDIVDHVLLPKHRLRYLEKLFTQGIQNDVKLITQMEISNSYTRERLVDDECYNMVEKYGCGKVDVYISKN